METECPRKVRHGLTSHPSPPSSLAPVSQMAPGNLGIGPMLTRQGWAGWGGGRRGGVGGGGLGGAQAPAFLTSSPADIWLLGHRPPP